VLSCAVWAGFDKPQKIYRGAFGREIALPIWVDIMNASVDRYPAKEIVQPPALKKVEICSRSGLLATDKCYDTVKGPTGDPVQHRTTYMEIGTAAQLPTGPCDVHEPHARLARDSSESEFPRAAAAVDVKEIQAVIVNSPAVLVDKDPYNSPRAAVRPTPEPEKQPELAEKQGDKSAPETGAPIMKAIPAAAHDKPTPEAVVPIMKAIPAGLHDRPVSEASPPVMKAIPVEPHDEKPLEIRKAVPAGPLDEVKDQTLLKSATPPPTDNLDQ
jgi:hypothetical protein